MTKINLLKYFDKSFSEIYQIEHEEIEKTSSKEVPKRVRNYLLTLSYLLVFILLLFAGYFTYKVFYSSKKTAKKNSTSIKMQVQPKQNKKTAKPQKGKYIKIAEIKILDKTNYSITPKEDINLTRKKTTKHITNNYNSTKSSKIILKKEKPKKITYYYKLTFYKVDSANFNKLKSLAKKYNLKFKQLKKYKVIKSIWRVYVVSPGSTQYIAGKPVKYLKYFENKYEAIQFAKNNKLKKAVIKKDKIIFYLFDLGIFPIKDKKTIDNLKKITKLKNIKITKIPFTK
ncbi:hypothetical protein [Deferribacter abyssi]|uniref:hypothetical protein n=1 Tax=Deferribacter abyssi TaxID=213806 RepID=UPI003C1B3033